MLLNQELTQQTLPVHVCAARLQRRSVVALVCVLASAHNAWAQSKETPLPTPASLQAAGAAAKAMGQPLVLMVSLPGCPWCELLRRNYLAPMRGEGVHAFQIMVNDRTRTVRDFSGAPSTGADIAQIYGAKLTPTLLFLNAAGQEIAPRIEGVASADLIGAQLQASFQKARERLTP
jgi:thioredoxin-related protein